MIKISELLQQLDSEFNDLQQHLFMIFGPIIKFFVQVCKKDYGSTFEVFFLATKVKKIYFF